LREVPEVFTRGGVDLLGIELQEASELEVAGGGTSKRPNRRCKEAVVLKSDRKP
jgi:hypothetical protein